MLILNSPHNPTGGVIPAADIAAIAEMVRDRDLMVLSDEIYSRIYFERSAALDQPRFRGCWRRPLSWMAFRRPTR